MKELTDEIEIYTITKKGSLGLLAYGDVGLRAWRKIRDKLGDEQKDE
ncbi:hypothetical protein [Hyunsoonleella aestuarii]|jgi:hypothetical protein|uniref:Uncharacterized protein n=1 Tax=Hyunsoonleella aestuarii TaxID=912802 RepID=A0ABP8EEQ5_9FLAO|nr:hypothetical protein [Hyunsoonleella aestuarii]